VTRRRAGREVEAREMKETGREWISRTIGSIIALAKIKIWTREPIIGEMI
jgi:hypothetical protein